MINLLRELALEDPVGSMKVLRMDQFKFEESVALISPAIKKQDAVMRSSISCKTNNFELPAKGDSFRSLGLLFKSTIVK